MIVQLRLRRGTADEWSAANPVLAEGEPGLDTTGVLLKIGDGILGWNDLPIFANNPETIFALVVEAQAAQAAAEAAATAAQTAADDAAGAVTTETTRATAAEALKADATALTSETTRASAAEVALQNLTNSTFVTGLNNAIAGQVATATRGELITLTTGTGAAAANTAAINAAITAANTAYLAGAGVSRYVLPEGTYWIQRTPGAGSNYSIHVSSGIELVGQGEGKTILKVMPFTLDHGFYEAGYDTTGFYQSIFYIKGVDASHLLTDIYLHDFTVDGNLPNMTGTVTNANSGDTFDTDYCSNSVRLERLTVLNSTSDGFDYDHSFGLRSRFNTAIGAAGFGFHNSQGNDGVIQIGNYAEGCGFGGLNRGGFDQYAESTNGVYIACVAVNNYLNFEIRGSNALVVGCHSAGGTQIDVFEGAAMYQHPGTNKGEIGLFGATGRVRFADQADPTNGVKRWLQYASANMMTMLLNNVVQLVVTSDQNLGVGGQTSKGATAAKAILLPDGTVPTSNPSTGGIMLADSGALRYRGSGGRLVTLVGNVTSTSAGYTADAKDELILATGGAGGITVTLPALVNGMRFTIKKVDAGVGAVTVTGTGANIDGAVSRALTSQYDRITVIAATGAWHVTGVNNTPVNPIGTYRPTGVQFETFSRMGALLGNLNTVLTSQRMNLYAIHLDAGSTLTSLSCFSGTTPLATGVNQWFALYDASLNLIRQTADDGATAWAATARKTLALSSSYSVPTTGLYYVGIMVNATTPPSLLGLASGSSSIITGLAPSLAGGSTTGLTTTAPSTAAAITASASIAYVQAL